MPDREHPVGRLLGMQVRKEFQIPADDKEMEFLSVDGELLSTGTAAYIVS